MAQLPAPGLSDNQSEGSQAGWDEWAQALDKSIHAIACLYEKGQYCMTQDRRSRKC